VQHTTTTETTWQHEFRIRPESDRFLREFDSYYAVYELLETKRKFDLTMRLLDIGRQVREGNRSWVMSDLEDIARWKGLQPPMLVIKKSAPDIDRLLQGAFGIENEEARIGALCTIQGIGPVLASTILMFTWPENCGFMDYHTWNSLRCLSFDLSKKHCTSRFTVPQLSAYLRIIRLLGENKRRFTMDVVKALYALDNTKIRKKWKEQLDAVNGRLPTKNVRRSSPL